MFVCLFLFCLIWPQTDEVVITSRFISLRMQGVQSVAVIIDFIYGQSIFFKSFDCRSEGIVPAKTCTYIEKLVRKESIKNIFHKKCIRR